jgi:hypothetical protein
MVGEIGKEMYLNMYSMEEVSFEHDTLSLLVPRLENPLFLIILLYKITN